jgi:hypothetical protein
MVPVVYETTDHDPKTEELPYDKWQYHRTVIPAAPGWRVCRYTTVYSETAPVTYCPETVIAWVIDVRVNDLEPLTQIWPICCDENLGSDDDYFFIAPDGVVTFPYGFGVFPDVAEAEAHLAAEWNKRRK